MSLYKQPLIEDTAAGQLNFTASMKRKKKEIFVEEPLPNSRLIGKMERLYTWRPTNPFVSLHSQIRWRRVDRNLDD